MIIYPSILTPTIPMITYPSILTDYLICTFNLSRDAYSELLQALLSGEAGRRQQVNSYNTNTTNARGMYDIIKQECLNQPRRKWKVKEAFPKE